MLSINGKKVSISAVKTDCNLTPLTVKENGTYFPEESDGFNKVVVEVEAEEKESVVLKPLTVTQNGPYEGGIEDGKQVGFNPVVVDVKPDKSAVVKQIIEARGGRADYLFYAISPKSALTTELAEELIKYDTFEDTDNLNYAFYYADKITRFPKMNTAKVKEWLFTFYGAVELIEPPDIDLSGATNIGALFQACVKLKSLPSYDTRKVEQVSQTCWQCYALETIGEWDLRNCTWIRNFVLECRNIKEIWIKNLQADIQVGIATSWGHLLTQESAIHLLYECRDTGSAKTVTFSSQLQPVLQSVYVKSIAITDEMREQDDLVDEKLPFVVCEPTDEGATLITEYVLQKNWQVAFA